MVTNPLTGNEKNILTSDDCYVSSNEKVYVQLSRHNLLVGEQLFYKAFVVNASNHTFSDSKIIHFELFNPSVGKVDSWRANLEGGCFNGSYTIPRGLPPGVYFLSAYTNWMRNNGEAYFFQAKLFINDFSSQYIKSFTDYIKICKDIEVFPEGGTLIAGLENRIIVKKHERFSSYQDGIILDESNLPVVNFRFNSNNFAEVNFVPQPGENYKIKIGDSISKAATMHLPGVQASGVHLKSNPTAKAYNIEFTKVNLNIANLRLLVRQRGRVVLDSLIFKDSNKAKIHFPFTRCKRGIIHALLIDDKNNVIFQRLFFNPGPGDNLFKFDSKDLSSPGSVHELSLKNLGQKQIAGSLIARKSQLLTSFDSYQNMDYYLNFYSELAYPVYLPGASNLSLSFIDKVLATIPISSYLWNIELSNNIQCSYLKENDGFILQGKVMNEENESLPGETILLTSPGEITILKCTQSDSKGLFYFKLPGNYDNIPLLIQIPGKNKEINILWQNEFNKFARLPVDSVIRYFDHPIGQSFTEEYIVGLVDAIYSLPVEDNPGEKKVNTFQVPFYHQPYYFVKPKEYTHLKSFQEIEDNLLDWVKFRKKKDEYSLRCIDLNSKELFDQEAGVFLNGIFFEDLEYISNLTSKDIEVIKVLNSKIFYGDLTFHGIISITTNDNQFPTPRNSKYFINKVQPQFEGKGQQFPSPGLESGNIPFFKKILHVDHHLDLKAGEEEVIKMQVSHLKGEFDIIFDGISENGEVISKISRFIVK